MSNSCKVCGSRNVYVGLHSIECLDRCGKPEFKSEFYETQEAFVSAIEVKVGGSTYPNQNGDSFAEAFEEDGVTPYGWYVAHHDFGDC